MKVAVIIVAAGTSSRFSLETPKIYCTLQECSVLEYGVRNIVMNELVSHVVCVINPLHLEYYQNAFKHISPPPYVFGGESRRASVSCGMRYLQNIKPDAVLIHDAARPLASKTLFTNVINALKNHSVVDVAVPIYDTVKMHKVEGALEVLNRDTLYATQTPQGFHFPLLLEALEKNIEGTDEVSLFCHIPNAVHTVPGENSNIKITTVEDLTLANLHTL